MKEVEAAHHALDQLCTAVKAFSDSAPRTVHYRAPVIDHFHPDGYTQRTIAGLSRFLSHAQAERDYVEGIIQSGHAPVEFTTNAPNLLAIWDEVEKAPGPILLVSQMLDLDTTDRRRGQAKLDIIADGGNEWIKISTIKESRLMAEFREQDSYINSDYDSDSDLDFEVGPDDVPTSMSTMGTPPAAGLTNSLIAQARTLVTAAETFRRPQGLPQPRVRFVLNRMSEDEEYADSRVQRTFDVIRDMGVNLVLGDRPRSPSPSPSARCGAGEPIPTRNVLLDLSVLVALCCDSAHHPLPIDNEGLESRFRALRATESGVELAEHNNVTRDLRDQLQWEMQHSLIGEMQVQLAKTLDRQSDCAGVQFWVTEEVKGRLPNIVDIIGGDREKARAKAMFREDDEADLDFWQHSRWKGKVPALGDMRVKILSADDPPSLTGLGVNDDDELTSPFHHRLVRVCENMLSPPSDSLPSPTPLHKQKFRQSKNPKRPYTYYPTSSPASTRAPSPHTLNSFVAAAKRGWTVLTNNRGAVNKVMRDMGVMDGLPYEAPGERQWAVVWVVNPSSLSEWRRLEVEDSNRVLLQDQRRTPRPGDDGSGTGESSR